MRFSKSSIKLTLFAGRLLNKQSHVQVKQAHESCRKELFYLCKKPLRQSSYDFYQILVQRLQKWAQR
jgi:hypothetical protein